MHEAFQLGGDPGQIRSSARQWSTFAEAAATASSGIRLLDTSEFTGDEAQTYQDQINADLPQHLDTASTAWTVVAAALNVYAADLERHQQKMGELSVRAGNQQTTVNSCQGAVDSAQRSDRTHTLTLLRTRESLPPGDEMPDDGYVSYTSTHRRQLSDAQTALQATYDAASTVRSENAESVRRCRSEIDRAKGMRFAKPPGFWGRLKDSVCGWIADHAGVLLQISSVLKTISGIAGMLALIPIPGVQEVMAGIALTTGGAALLIDVGVKLATGKGSWTQIGLDALSMIPGARAAKLAYVATTGYTAYNVATGKASMSDLVMTVGMGALSMRGGGKLGGEGRGGNGMPTSKIDGAGTRPPATKTAVETPSSAPPAKPPVYEPVRRRVTLRAKTKRDVYLRAQRDSNNEDFICAADNTKRIPCERLADGTPVRVDPDTGRPDPAGMTVPQKGSFNFGHKPGHEWRTYKVEAEQNGYDRSQVIEDQNDPKIYRIETPEANQSHQYELH